MSEAELENGSSVTTEVMKYTACTDASQKMWRMSYGDIHIGGEWTKEELQIADSNINALELLAIKKALFKLKKEIQPSILVRSDSTTAVSYINNMGGHGSDKCNFIAHRICLSAKNCNIQIRCAHLTGKDNCKADFMRSLLDTKNTEWSLNITTYHIIREKFGNPDVDIFASAANFKCHKCVSWHSDRNAWVIDAFTIAWNKISLVYAFLPFSLLGKILDKSR